MNRKLLWPVLLIGILLVVAPFAISLPSKASAGERMMSSFQPIMQPDQVKTTAYYYNDVFVPLGKVAPMMSAENVKTLQAYLAGFKGVQTDSAKLVPMLAQGLGTTPAQVQAYMGQQTPAMAAMLRNLPRMQQDFGGLLGTMQNNVGIVSQVPAGLDHYQPLVTTMQANVDDYRQVSSLPDFRLFTWFFVVPGVLLIMIATWGLLPDATRERLVPTTDEPRTRTSGRGDHARREGLYAGPLDVPTRPRADRQPDGWMFWFTWKRFVGSYRRLTSASRS